MSCRRQGRPPEGRLFHGWRVAWVAFLANLLSTGTTFYVFNAFLLPLCEIRGWTRAEVNAAPMLGFVFGLLAQYCYGSLFLRVGPRLLMVLGSLVSSLSFIMLGRVSGLAGFYILYTMVYLGNGAMNGIVANTVVSNWFVAKRGRALGLATAGMSVSGVVLPWLATLILEAAGLETAFLVIGLLVLLLAPLAWRVVRISPESCGLLPDGVDASAGGGWTGPEEAPDQPWSTSAVLKAGAFWKLGAAYSLAMMGAVGVTYQLAPRFTDQGWGGQAAIAMTALVAALATAGKFLWGLFCDLADPRRVVAGLLVLKALGLALGLWPASLTALALFIALFGFSMGGVMATYPIMAAHLFGRARFWRVYRLLALFLAFQGLGYLFMGQSFTRTGSYDSAFVCFIVLDLIAAALIMRLPRPAVDKSRGRGGNLPPDPAPPGGPSPY